MFGMGGAAMLLGLVIMVVVLVLIVLAVIWAVRGVGRAPGPGRRATSGR